MYRPWLNAPKSPRRAPVALLLPVVVALGCTPAASGGASSPDAGPPSLPTTSPSAVPSPSETAPSPDQGALIVFQSLADEFDRRADDDGIEHDDTVFVVSAEGGEPRRLVPVDFVGSEIRPTWSPDGERVAFIRARLPDDDAELWVVNVDGTGAELLYDCGEGCNSIGDPDWSPDGSAIYFARDSNVPADGPPLTFEIWRHDIDAGEARPVLTREDGMSVEQPRISPDARQAVYVRWRNLVSPSSDCALFVADLGTGEERRLTDWDLLPAYPDWSVDDRIVFNSYDLRLFPDTSEAANIYTMDVDGSDLTRLTDHGRRDVRATQPRWTADGAGIVFTEVTPWARDAFGDRHIAWMGTDGTGQRILGGGVVGTHPELQPVGTP